MSLASRPWEAELLDRVGELLSERAASLARQGRPLASLGSLDELAGRMVAALPTVHPDNASLGPFYDTGHLVLWLGVSRQALADRVRRGTLLACRTADGRLLYPSLQFGRRGQVRPGLVDVIAILSRAGADGWAVGAWLTSASALLDGLSPVSYLAAHESSPAALDLLRQEARAEAEGHRLAAARSGG